MLEGPQKGFNLLECNHFSNLEHTGGTGSSWVRGFPPTTDSLVWIGQTLPRRARYSRIGRLSGKSIEKENSFRKTFKKNENEIKKKKDDGMKMEVRVGVVLRIARVSSPVNDVDSFGAGRFSGNDL